MNNTQYKEISRPTSIGHVSAWLLLPSLLVLKERGWIGAAALQGGDPSCDCQQSTLTTLRMTNLNSHLLQNPPVLTVEIMHRHSIKVGLPGKLPVAHKCAVLW